MGDITSPSTPLDTVKDLIVNRHSVRKFLPTPIPNDVLEKALAIAQHTASNNNFQPWRAVVVTGAKLHSLRSALEKAWTAGPPDLPNFPAEYKHYKETFGEEFYGKLLGISRDEPEKRHIAMTENYGLHGAPVAIIVYMDKRLSKYDMIGVGFWMQNLCLILRAQEIEACYMASIAGYPELLRRELDLPEGIEILSGIAVGCKDDNHIRNTLRLKKDDWKESVEFRN
ncbi:Nitroreductase-like protein [Xylogone sp. PMI_703]|nr:Nitroreductase-like protein [Xylogone sp. PMI_703]